MGQREPGEREQPDTPAEQSGNRQTRDQHQEHIEQAPALDPRVGRAVSSERCDQAMTWWHVQYPAHTGEAALPSRCRHRGACIDTAYCLHLHLGRAQFDSSPALGSTLGHKQVLISNSRAQQAIRFDHVEAPALAHLAADRVHGCESIVAEVEPQPRASVS